MLHEVVSNHNCYYKLDHNAALQQDTLQYLNDHQDKLQILVCYRHYLYKLPFPQQDTLLQLDGRLDMLIT